MFSLVINISFYLLFSLSPFFKVSFFYISKFWINLNVNLTFMNSIERFIFNIMYFRFRNGFIVFNPLAIPFASIQFAIHFAQTLSFVWTIIIIQQAMGKEQQEILRKQLILIRGCNKIDFMRKFYLSTHVFHTTHLLFSQPCVVNYN